MNDFTIIGVGFAGSVVAERLASAGHQVLVIDQRPHIGGNAYDEPDAHGVLVHRYGPYINYAASDVELEVRKIMQIIWHEYLQALFLSSPFQVSIAPSGVATNLICCLFTR